MLLMTVYYRHSSGMGALVLRGIRLNHLSCEHISYIRDHMTSIYLLKMTSIRLYIKVSISDHSELER